MRLNKEARQVNLNIGMPNMHKNERDKIGMALSWQLDYNIHIHVHVASLGGYASTSPTCIIIVAEVPPEYSPL